MKKYMKYFLILTVMALVLTSCEEERITFTGKQVGFESATGGIMIPKTVTTTQVGTFKVMLIAAPQSAAVTLTLAVNTEESTAIEGTHFTMANKTVTIPAGQSFADFTVTALNSGFTFGGEFKKLVLDIASSSVDVAGEFSRMTLNISKEAFIDAFRGTFVAHEYYPPDPDPAYGPYTVSCTVIPGTNNISLMGIWDWATQAVVVQFNPDPNNKTLTVARQVFNPGVWSGLSVEGTGRYDDNAQTFEIDAKIYDGAALEDEVTIRYRRPGGKSFPLGPGKAEIIRKK